MKRLLEAELIYGRLLPIAEPHLVERYNKALDGFGIRRTALDSFRIDMTGFSPEIADDIDDLLSINEVRFRVLSAEDMLGKAGELRALVDRLKTVPNAWQDDAMLNRMVELAKQTGDIRQNALVPDKLVFRHDAYWANHFGGIFVFVDEKTTTVICDPEAPGFRRSRPWQVSYIAKTDHARIFDFLASTKRLDLPRASWVEGSGPSSAITTS